MKPLRSLHWMVNKMKAAVLYGKRDLRVEEIDPPKLNSDEVLVKVEYTGICGSDLPRVLGNAAHYYPIILGHEFSGEVVETGPGVKNVTVGDRVAGSPLIPCHQCPDCLRGNYALCKHYSFIGSRLQGSWAEYVKLPARNAVRLPDGVTYEQGAFFEPATVALHGLLVMGFSGGCDVAIIGMGTIGLLTLQCAKILGAKRIFAFDLDQDKLALAQQLGADVCVNTGDDQFREVLPQLITEQTGGAGFEQVIDAAGVEFTEKLSLELAANKGNVMFIGTPSQNVTLTPHQFEHFNRKELTVRGSWMSYSAPFPGREWELAGYYFQNGQLTCDLLLDRKIPLTQIETAFHDFMIPGKVNGKVLMKG